MLEAVAALALALAPSPRACTAHELLPLGGRLQGATGSMVGSLRIRNVSASACRVGGRPSASVADRSGKLLPTRERRLSPELRVTEVLRPGQVAELELAWSNWCGTWPRGVLVRQLRLRLTLTTGARLTLPLRSGRPRCDLPTVGSSLALSPFGR